MTKALFFMASLLLYVLSLSSLAVATQRLDLAGSYKPIKNIDDPEIQSLGEFAVTEHNKQTKTQLQFQKVISGDMQIVAGTNYKLRLTALEGTDSRTYGTLVFTDLNNKNNLINFFNVPN
ncbi:cysteine proteinase inhibitor 1-like [Cucurbita pepo subsp. pepo]|uniref:cysteine proteinase inhibitor 1-like n=1 Tax=Cucurbita pepo subsp. pepo TaxID=3664 RepID=UPI000C9D31AF|nr:cysteine proteinase inhibitor 1-like [Cucurbita pepo subsp. pepo]